MKSPSSSLGDLTARVDIHPKWKEEALEHEWISLKGSLLQQLLHVDKLLRSTHLTCKTLPMMDRLANKPQQHKDEGRAIIAQFDAIAQEIRDSVSQEEGPDDSALSEPCALLYLEKAFISLILQLSETVYDVTLNSFSGDGAFVFEEEMLIILNAILSEALDASNVFVGKGHFSRHGFSEESVNHAFARVAQMVLRTTRQLVSRPLVMHPPQNIFKHHKSGTIDRDFALSMSCWRLMWRLFVLCTGVASLPSKPAAVSGGKAQESNLLHLFHDMHSVVALATGAEVIHTPETMYYDAVQEERDAVAWEDMLPSLYIPKHIEIEIYVVKLQRSYDPIGECTILLSS
jgi:hypothetical protein